jgi:hypothetical protein
MREGHLERHIRRMRRLYGQRREVLVDSLARNFGERATVFGDPAGMHVLVRFADEGIAERSARNKVQITNAGAYYLGKAPRVSLCWGSRRWESGPFGRECGGWPDETNPPDRVKDLHLSALLLLQLIRDS